MEEDRYLCIDCDTGKSESAVVCVSTGDRVGDDTCMVAFDLVVINCTNCDGLSYVPVGRSEGKCSCIGADLSVWLDFDCDNGSPLKVSAPSAASSPVTLRISRFKAMLLPP
jgi:hypothetical protein